MGFLDVLRWLAFPLLLLLGSFLVLCGFLPSVCFVLPEALLPLLVSAVFF